MSILLTAVNKILKFTRRKKRRLSSPALSLILCLITLGLIFPDTKLPINALSRPPAIRILVSYVYYETPLQQPCEALNKRMNLAFFFRQAVANSEENVEFLFSHANEFPDARDLLELLVDVKLEEKKFITKALQGRYSHIRFRTVKGLAPDICHHQVAIKEDLKKRTKPLDFYMIMNDGVRGPFLNPASTAQVRPLFTNE